MCKELTFCTLASHTLSHMSYICMGLYSVYGFLAFEKSLRYPLHLRHDTPIDQLSQNSQKFVLGQFCPKLKIYLDSRVLKDQSQYVAKYPDKFLSSAGPNKA